MKLILEELTDKIISISENSTQIYTDDRDRHRLELKRFNNFHWKSVLSVRICVLIIDRDYV